MGSGESQFILKYAPPYRRPTVARGEARSEAAGGGRRGERDRWQPLAAPAAERGALLWKLVARTMGGATMGELMAQARAAGISVADIEECLNENLLAPKEALAALTQRRVSFCVAGCECHLYCRRARAMRVTSRAADRGG